MPSDAKSIIREGVAEDGTFSTFDNIWKVQQKVTYKLRSFQLYKIDG